MTTGGLWLTALAIAIGLVGIVVPVLPGILLVGAAILVWALVESSVAGWVVFGLAAAVLLVSQVVKYTVPGRRLKAAGVPSRSLLAGGLLGIVGFFVIPVVGLFLGFVGGVYLVERQRVRSHPAAWSSTKQALKAAGLSILIELAAGLVMAGIWLVAVLLT